MSVTATTHGKRRSTGSARTESIGFRILGWGLFLGVLVALGFASIPSHQKLPTSTSETLLWITLVAAASLVPLTSQRGPALVMDLPVLLGVGFVFGPFMAGLVSPHRMPGHP